MDVADQSHILLPRPYATLMQGMDEDISRVSCQKGPICHAWRVGPFWQDTIDISAVILQYPGILKAKLKIFTFSKPRFFAQNMPLEEKNSLSHREITFADMFFTE